MSLYGTIYRLDIKPMLLDWITNSATGRNVENVPLYYANRAQTSLWSKKPWSNLVTRVTVTLTSGSYSLPSNFGRLIDMYADLAGHGTPDYWYYDGDNYENGYKLDAGFSKASGFNQSITFHYTQQSSVYMRYQKILDDFTDDADNAEYSFFPANLILLEAQKMNSLDKGNIKEYQGFENSFNIMFKDFCNTTLWVNYDPGPYLKDRYGHEVVTNNYSLSGEYVQPYSALPNSHIL